MDRRILQSGFVVRVQSRINMFKEVQVSRPTREIYCKRSASLRREQLCTAGENKHYVASSSLGHKIESNEKASSPSPQPCTEAINLETILIKISLQTCFCPSNYLRLIRLLINLKKQKHALYLTFYQDFYVQYMNRLLSRDKNNHYFFIGNPKRVVGNSSFEIR